MKKLQLVFFGTLTIASVLFYSSCSPDDVIIADDSVEMIDPSLGFVSIDPSGVQANDYPTSDFEISPDEPSVVVAIEAVAGTGDLKSLTVQLDGTNLTASDFEIRDLISNESITSNNPLLIVGDNTSAFTFEIKLDNDGSLDPKALTFIVEDVDGLTNTINISFNSYELIEQSISGVLLNAAGPVGTGGLDLDTGEGTGTLDASGLLAEIKDEGIDLSLPNDQNWKAQISGINNSEIKTLSSSVENFDFASVNRKDVIEKYFEGGDDLPNTNANNEKVSNTVSVGDVFVVHRDGKTYLIEVTDVMTTANDNADAIEFSIKY